MIDHVSLAVRDIPTSKAFYESLLTPLGYRVIADRGLSVAFGKTYPEVWLNHRAGLPPVPEDTGIHVCLRARSEEAVRAFFGAAIANGGRSAGEPGPRQAELTPYYAAFIFDPDGNKLEAATFPASPA